MSKGKKFNAFGGVFTPSILTILGVIMYMRLGWVVGEAGLVGALLIILIAHIISFSTGLSISSIATDKKIKTGGIYYMLSRSLGLPMGGAIGLALTFGTALSISLYIVGFIESFLGVEAIRNFLNVGLNLNDFRIVGSVVLIVLVVIAFISTSLAIKTQYIILAAIGLSLLSIFAGMFMNIDFQPEQLQLAPVSSVPLQYVFSIYFPAVTGFTAGVAMSGDLKDPRKDIPRGTLGAIIVGFVVYIALTVGFSLRVDGETLRNNPQFLLELAWSSPLVIAGIWGATLSSALGGILGAPRILQAISRDRVMPRFLGKGYGPSNEPRNALLLIFLIAEAGILIGDLNVIAGIVSMFFLTSYGFINLSYSLESWASSDFRPDFRMPGWIGIVGFVACFIVMSQIDFLSMSAAFVIIALIYYYLRRRRLRLDFGDVWQSVWSTIIRRALTKLETGDIEKRNWRPNILLFSGGSSVRSQLINIGKSLLGRHGMLSNFDLVEDPDSEVFFTKQQQVQKEESQQNEGIFTRRQVCRNVYEGIETIASTYGFSGVEPNTVLMGWARQSRNPERFGQMVRYLSGLDLSILMLDYDDQRGFGEKKQIDIWWRGAGNNGNLALSLVRFMLQSEQWRNAKVRLLTVNPINEEYDIMYRRTRQILENFRIDAEIKIVNNKIEQKDFRQIVKEESIDADLIMLGIPEIKKGSETSFIEKTNQLVKDIGTVVFIKASSYFSDLYSVDKERVSQLSEADQKQAFAESRLEMPEMPVNPVLAFQYREIHGFLQRELNRFYNNTLKRIYDQDQRLLKTIQDYFYQSTQNIERELQKEDADIPVVLKKHYNSLLIRIREAVNQYQKEYVSSQEIMLREGIQLMFSAFRKFKNELPRVIKWRAYRNQDNKKIRSGRMHFRKKMWKRLKLSMRISMDNLLFALGEKSLQNQLKVQAIIKEVFGDARDILHSYQGKETGNFSMEQFIVSSEKIYASYAIDLSRQPEELLAKMHDSFNLIWKDENYSNLVSKSKINSSRKRVKELDDLPSKYVQNKKVLLNYVRIELLLQMITFRLRGNLKELETDIIQIYHRHVIAPLEECRHFLKKGTVPTKQVPINEREQQMNFKLENLKDKFEASTRRLKYIIRKYPPVLEVFTEESFNNFLLDQYKRLDLQPVYAPRMLDYFVQYEFEERITNQLFSNLSDIFSVLPILSDSYRLLDYTQKDVKAEELEKGSLKEMISNQEERIAKEEDRFSKRNQAMLEEILRLDSIVKDQLIFEHFLGAAKDVKGYIKVRESKRKKNIFIRSSGFISNKWSRFVSAISYRTSMGWVMAHQKSTKVYGKNLVSRCLDFMELRYPKTEVLKKLPTYYQQLLLSKHHYLNEFWYGRKKEIEEADKAIQRQKTGVPGGIIITGEYGSGKSFLANYIGSKHFALNNFFVIQPPFAGTITEHQLDNIVQRAFETNLPAETAFSQLPEGSAVLWEDIELWWRRVENGDALLKRIFSLYHQYKDRLLFIFTMGEDSFGIVKKLFPLERMFLANIRIAPFHAEELRDLIGLRSKAAGLEVDNYKGERLGSWKQARYFNKLFMHSNGNVNAALHAWASWIDDFEDNRLFIRPRGQNDITIIEELPKDWLFLLSILALHKRISRRHLFEMLAGTIPEKAEMLNAMKSAGLISEGRSNVFEINPYIYIPIRLRLKQLKLL